MGFLRPTGLRTLQPWSKELVDKASELEDFRDKALKPHTLHGYQDPHWPFNGALMVLNSGCLGYVRG